MKFNKSTFFTILALTPLTSNAIDLGTHKGVQLDLTLQINRAFMHADNGSKNDVFFVDNDNSSTRLNFKAESKLYESILVGGQFEAEYQSNASNLVDYEKKSSDPEFDERIMEAWISSEKYGRVSLGQGPGAADGNMERELSGTNVINWANPALIGGGIKFGNNGPKISATMSNLDFESRYDRFRYDSPSFGPIAFAFSQGTKNSSDITELAARLEHKLESGVQLRGAIGYSLESTPSSSATGDEQTVGGSFAVKFDNGFNAAIAIAKSSDDNPLNPDSSFKSIKAGYIEGKHSVSLMYAQSNDRSKADDESSSISLGYVFKLEKWMELYAGYKVHSLDRPGTDYDDIHIATSGIRLKF